MVFGNTHVIEELLDLHHPIMEILDVKITVE